MGIPQGGIIASLIVNFTLNGLEKAAFEKVIRFIREDGKPIRINLNLIRYGYDFLIITNPESNLQKIESNITNFLKLRGLELNEEKSRCIRFSDQPSAPYKKNPKFDFLGFTFMYVQRIKVSRIVSRWDQVERLKCLIYPSRENVVLIRHKLKVLINKSKNLSAMELIARLNPIISGWVNYFGLGVCTKVLCEIDNYVYRRL